jgi:hypothetical protein
MSVTNSEQTQEIHNTGSARGPRARKSQTLDFARLTRPRACSDFVTDRRYSNFCTNPGHNAPRLWYDSPTFVGGVPMLPAGKSLRTLREKLGLTMRDVENSSARVADKYRNEEFSIPPSRLSDI